ncbi:unnamed protein product [Protopolystoma xenopodis]|uniref:Uncharacterized protein n=1 Tax=Protopolystoma xenopodis TaxID=117903 RepID=A0A3S5BSQ3_9PLAT|nr:unnamed protein product [Protopolystoma xenopodis]
MQKPIQNPAVASTQSVAEGDQTNTTASATATQRAPEALEEEGAAASAPPCPAGLPACPTLSPSLPPRPLPGRPAGWFAISSSRLHYRGCFHLSGRLLCSHPTMGLVSCRSGCLSNLIGWRSYQLIGRQVTVSVVQPSLAQPSPAQPSPARLGSARLAQAKASTCRRERNSETTRLRRERDSSTEAGARQLELVRPRRYLPRLSGRRDAIDRRPKRRNIHTLSRPILNLLDKRACVRACVRAAGASSSTALTDPDRSTTCPRGCSPTRPLSADTNSEMPVTIRLSSHPLPSLPPPPLEAGPSFQAFQTIIEANSHSHVGAWVARLVANWKR